MLPEKIKAVYLNKPFDVTEETIAIPQPGPREVLVKVMAVGVCGSDIHYYEHGKIGRYVVNKPMILGHECSGEVVRIGNQVSRVKIGDRVAVEPGIACGLCSSCKEGRYNLCPHVRFLATPPVDGAFAQYICHQEDFVFVIPDEMSYEEAALIEPLSVGIHAVKRSGLRPGSTVAIMGMGPVGLMAIAAAKAFGARHIIVADLEEARLSAARKLGATHTVKVSERDPVQSVLEWTGGEGADVALETAGNPKALQAALKCLKRGGALSAVGLSAASEISLDMSFVVDNEIDIHGIFRYANTYPTGIRILSSGLVDVRALVTDKYPLAQTQEALEQARTNKQHSLKVMVYPNDSEYYG